MLLIILVIVSACVCAYCYWCTHTVARDVAVLPNGIPGLGHCLMFARENIFTFVKNIGEHCVENGGMSVLLFGPAPAYVIADPAKATVILNTCLEKMYVYKLINPLFGDQLVSASVPIWKRNRRILDLAFKPQVLEGYMGVFNTQASRLLEMLDKKAENGYVDLTDEITRNVLETTCQTTMGMLPKEQNYVNDRYVKALHEVFRIVTLRFQKPWMLLDSVFYFCRAKKDLDEALKVIHEVSAKMVKLRKMDYLERSRNKNDLVEKNGKIISYLDIVIENSMSEEGSLFTDLQLRYLCDNILLAGFDTTTYELLFTLVCIGSDQEVQRKIHQEIKEVLGEEETVRKEHLRYLRYLEAAIKEAIRLYPVGVLIGRQATAEVQLGDVTLPSASLLIVHLWAINRNRKYWGPDAEKFNPDRWLSPATLPEHPNAFSSFSFARRNCIGKQYALMHMKATLVPILRKYRITSDHEKMDFDCYIMLKVKSGHLMKLQLRERTG